MDLCWVASCDLVVVLLVGADPMNVHPKGVLATMWSGLLLLIYCSCLCAVTQSLPMSRRVLQSCSSGGKSFAYSWNPGNEATSSGVGAWSYEFGSGF